jgi:16S rRNA (guanine966-N2)-methyltransferase
MRIIGGKFRGKKIMSPLDAQTRPTSDRTREAIFNLLENSLQVKIENTRVLDVFAGTGALGLEALSRGAAYVGFIESHPLALKVLKQNIDACIARESTSIFPFSAAHVKSCPSAPYHLIFLDPPYHQGLVLLALEKLCELGWMKDECLVVTETPLDEEIQYPQIFELLKTRAYGRTKITILKFNNKPKSIPEI